MVQREKRERPTERARLAGGAGQEGPSSCPCSARKPVACSRNEATSSWFHSTIFCPSVNESNNAGRHTANSRGTGRYIGLNVPLSDQKTSQLTSYIHLHLHTIDYCWFSCFTSEDRVKRKKLVKGLVKLKPLKISADNLVLLSCTYQIYMYVDGA